MKSFFIGGIALRIHPEHQWRLLFSLTISFFLGLSFNNLSGQTSLVTDGSTRTVYYNGSVRLVSINPIRIERISPTAQDFILPASLCGGTISFTIKAGDGGRVSLDDDDCLAKGGQGATVTVDLSIGIRTGQVPPGSKVRFIVGGRGASANVGSGFLGSTFEYGGGGGGSAVLFQEPGSSTWQLVAVAGGGGGAYQGKALGFCVDNEPGQGGRSGENGGSGNGDIGAGTGGTAGAGGDAGGLDGVELAGGGGGRNSAGDGVTCITTSLGTREVGEGQRGFPAGGHGGRSESCTGFAFRRGGWGFGGGGAGFGAAGGGGGYSGGAGGGTTGRGGGGGSWTNSELDFSASNKSAGSTTSSPSNGSIKYKVNVETQPPVALCKDVTVTLNNSGSISITASQVDDNSVDCDGGAVDLMVQPSTFDCGDVGLRFVTLIATGKEGQTDVCTAQVTVNSSGVCPPIARCKDGVTVSIDADEMASIVAADLDDGSFDPDGGNLTFTVNRTTFDCKRKGYNPVTLTVEDPTGRTDACQTGVVVQDPSGNCPQEELSCDGTTTDVVYNGQEAEQNGEIITIPPTFQDYQIPFSVCSAEIEVTLRGGDGGFARVGSSCVGRGGVGATTTYRFAVGDAVNEIPPGSVLRFSIGGQGESSPESVSSILSLAYAGGGGGTGLLFKPPGGSDWIVLAAAGGGGGGYSGFFIVCTDESNGQGGRTVLNGGINTDGDLSNAEGGMNGLGGQALDVNVLGRRVGGGGGGGARGAGVGVDCDGNIVGEGQAGSIAGDFGGESEGCTLFTFRNGGYGFGGGGAGFGSGGGGGGYSGGGAGGTTGGGGGGGSFMNTFYQLGGNISGNDEGTLTPIDGFASISCTITDCRPVAECKSNPVDVALDAGGLATITGSLIDNGSSDQEDGAPSLSVVPNSFDCTDIGMRTVTLTVTDVAGQSNSCQATVNVMDNIAPNASCKNVTVALDEAGFATISLTDIDDGSADACGIQKSVLDRTNFDCQDIGGQTVQLTLEDNNGNESTCSATVTVVDNIAPIAICTDAVISLDAGGNASLSVNAINGGSFDACGLSTVSLSQSDFTCADVISLPKLVDSFTNAGRVIDYNIVTLNGQNARVINVAPGTAVTLGFNWTNRYESNFCPGCIQQFYVGISGDGVAEDCIFSGQTRTTFTRFNSIDLLAPISPGVYPISIGSSLQVNCVERNFGERDLCGAANGIVAVIIVGEDVLPSTTLLVADQNGNTSSCEASVVVVDQVAPTALCAPTTIQLDDNGLANLEPAMIDAGSNDACGIASSILDKTEFDCGDVGEQTVILTVTDPYCNQSTCTTSVTIEDNVAPIALCQNLTLELNDEGTVTTSATHVDDGSTDACGVTTIVIDQSTFLCEQVGENLVTLSVTDENENTATCTATITITDNTAPDLVCPLDVAIRCDESQAPENTGFAAGTDNCAVADITFIDEILDGSCADELTITRTWEIIDQQSNTSKCVQNIQVLIDEVPPVCLNCPEDIVVNCGEIPPVPSIVAVDNCDPDPTIEIEISSTQQSDGSCGAFDYQEIRTFTFTDRCGNVEVIQQTITVIDQIEPQISCPPAASVTCADNLDPSALGTPAISDNCDADLSLSFEDNQTDGDCRFECVIERVWTVSDACLNTSQCVQRIDLSGRDLFEEGLLTDIDQDDLADPIVIGAGSSTMSLTADAVDCIVGWLPHADGVATRMPRNGSVVDIENCLPGDNELSADGKIVNPLLGEVIALSINIRLNPAIGEILLSELDCDIPNVLSPTIRPSTTVNGFLNTANAALAGIYPKTYSEMTDLIKCINRSYQVCQPFSDDGIGSVPVGEAIQAQQLTDRMLEQPNVSAFPNPTSGALWLDFVSPIEEPVSIRLYNALGSLVQEWQLTHAQIGRIPIDLSAHWSGVYILMIQTSDRSLYQQKIIVE